MATERSATSASEHGGRLVHTGRGTHERMHVQVHR